MTHDQRSWRTRTRDILHTVTWVLNSTFLALLAVTIFVAVLMRYVFKIAVPEVTIVQRFAVAWLVFLGAAIAVLDDQHLKIDIFGPFLSDRGKRVQRLIIDIVTTMAVGLLFLVGRKAFLVGVSRTELIEIRFLQDRISLAYFNTAFLAGAALMCVFHIFNVVTRYFTGRTEGHEESKS